MIVSHIKRRSRKGFPWGKLSPPKAVTDEGKTETGLATMFIKLVLGCPSSASRSLGTFPQGKARASRSITHINDHFPLLFNKNSKLGADKREKVCYTI